MTSHQARLGRSLLVVALVACADGTDPAGPGPVRLTSAVDDRRAVVVNPAAHGVGVAATIQEGLDMAADGGRVLVTPGVYEERLLVTKGVTIEPIAGGSGPVVVRQSFETSIPAAQAVISVLTSAPVVLRGFIVHHDNIRGVNLLRDGDVTVERMSFEGTADGTPIVGNGVTAHYGAGESGSRARLLVRDSRFAVGGIGISLGGDVDAVVAGNTVIGAVNRLPCLTVSPVGQGATMLTAPGRETNLEIVGNTFEDCGANLAGRFNGLIVGGTAGATTDGRVDIVGNTFRNPSATFCPGSAIVFEHYAGVIERNSIVDVVELHCAPPNPGRNWPSAIFVGSRTAGVRPARVTSVRFNDIVGNGYPGLRIAATQLDPIDATCNWWGDASGPSGIGSGTGDAVVVEPGGAPPTFAPFARAPIARTAATSC